MYEMLQSKKNGCRSGMYIERTDHNFWCLMSSIRRHVIHPSITGLPLVAFLALRSLLVLLLRTMVRHMSLFIADVASSRHVGSTILHWSGIGISSARSLLSILLILLMLLV
jgi:hypothetical protein